MLDSRYKEYPVKFNVKRKDNNRENTCLNISLLVNEGKIYNHKSNLTSENNFSDEWSWNFDNNDWKNVDINSENFMMSIDFNDGHHKKKFNYQVEKIKLGKTINFDYRGLLHFALIPMNEKLKC